MDIPFGSELLSMGAPAIVPLGVLAISLVIGVGGIVFMFKAKTIFDPSKNRTEIEIPLFGKLRTNYPAISAFFISAGLAAYMAHLWFGEPKRIPVTASVTVEGHGGEQRPHIVVGVIPGSALRFETVKAADDVYTFEIPVVAGELSYTGVAQIQSPGFLDTDIGTAISKDGKLRFDARLHESRNDTDIHAK